MPAPSPPLFVRENELTQSCSFRQNNISGRIVQRKLKGKTAVRTQSLSPAGSPPGPYVAAAWGEAVRVALSKVLPALHRNTHLHICNCKISNNQPEICYGIQRQDNIFPNFSSIALQSMKLFYLLFQLSYYTVHELMLQTYGVKMFIVHCHNYLLGLMEFVITLRCLCTNIL